MVSLVNSKIFIPFFTMKKKNIEQVVLLSVDNKQDFKKIFQIYHRQIFRLCLRITGNYEAAENITIKVFTEFYKELENSVCKIEFSGRLRKLAISRLISYKESQIK